MHETIAPPRADVTDRRCWRCLQMFPGDAEQPQPTRVDFWVCDPCAGTLLPSRGPRS